MYSLIFLRYSYYFWISALFLLLVISCYFLQDSLQHQKSNQHASEFTPDAYADTVRLIETDSHGYWKHKIDAETLIHYSSKNHTQLKKPIFTISQDTEQAPWIVHANLADSFNGDEQVILQGDIKAEQKASDNNTATLILTDTITIEQKKDLAHTTSHVQVISPESKIEADGVQIHLHDKRVKFLSHVKGHYVPNHS